MFEGKEPCSPSGPTFINLFSDFLMPTFQITCSVPFSVLSDKDTNPPSYTVQGAEECKLTRTCVYPQKATAKTKDMSDIHLEVVKQKIYSLLFNGGNNS